MPDQRFIDAMLALQSISDNVAVKTKGGKYYTMVKDRIEIFRREFGDEFGIVTNVDYEHGFSDGTPIVASAQILKNDRVIASGYAVEFVGSTKITEASPVEVAETSAIGRALACFGLAGGEYASLNEVEAHDRKEQYQAGAKQAQPTFRQPNGPVPAPVQTRDRPYTNAEKSEFWVPTDDDSMWLQPELTLNNICAQIDQLETTQDLGHYWSDLKGFVGAIKTENPDMLAEIKAAFATRHNAVSGGKN